MSINLNQNVNPVQFVPTDASGGDGGKSAALAFDYTDIDGGKAWGGDGGNGNAPWWVRGSHNDSHGGNGGDAHGGDAVGKSAAAAASSANGGHGGTADVDTDQNTTLTNQFNHSGNDGSYNTSIKESFNEDNDVTITKNSYNQDNDGLDNSGGTIKGSIVAGDDVENSGNSDDDTNLNNVGNKYDTDVEIDASDDDSYNYEDSYNSTDSHDDNLDLDIQHFVA